MRSIVTTYILVVAIIILANFYANAVFSLLNIIGSLVIIVWAISAWAQIRLRRGLNVKAKILTHYCLTNHHFSL